MAKKLLQDMAPKKSPSLERRKYVEKRIISRRPAKEKLEEEPIERKPIRKKSRYKYKMYLVALVSVIFLLFALSFLFSGAKVTVTPKVKDLKINDSLSAVKGGGANDLPFDLVVISGDESKDIQGGEEKDTSIPAQGSVLIYNAFSSADQKLDIDTRLEGSNGKIYKTKNKVVVPGVTPDGKPGSVQVGIYASSGGEEYNSTPLDFKIVGFKGTPKYEKFYARSIGEITGGFKGKSPVVSSLDKENATSELRVTLEAKLSKKVSGQVPNGFVLFKDATFFDSKDSDISFTPKENNLVTATVKGTLYGFLLDEEKLTKELAKDSIDGYNGEDLYTKNIKDLTFTLKDKENISFATVKNIEFNLSGALSFVWRVDETKLATDMVGKPKDEFDKILADYPNIDSANLVIRPFWKKNFPDKTKDIEVIVNYPN